MKKGLNLASILRSLNNYAVFFLLIAFVITCCMTLFLNAMADTMGLEFTGENIGPAAKLTFINVILLSLIITVIDRLRRSLTVDRPVKRIIAGAEKIMQGDFSVRIEKSKSLDPHDKFNEIIDCFNKMAQELSGTETLRKDFIANVSHELKTPLSVMHNYALLLKDGSTDEKQRSEYAAYICEASLRLADLTSNILRLNKLENQQISPASEVYELGEQLCECLLVFEDMWEEKGLEPETDIEDGVFIKADREMMSLVWNNLFSNAVKFSNPGGRIGLKLYTVGDFAYVSISDEGCGISPEVGARIFDKFYQADPSRQTRGNGLGLALVKRVIDLSGSEISVESQPGRGSCFTVKLRRHKNEADKKDTD